MAVLSAVKDDAGDVTDCAFCFGFCCVVEIVNYRLVDYNLHHYWIYTYILDAFWCPL